MKFKAVYNEIGYHRLKLDQEEPYRYELNGFIDPDMVRYAREQGDQDYEQLFQILYGDEDFQTHVLQIDEESTSGEHLLKMKEILTEFGFYQGDTASPVYDLVFLLAVMKFKQYANQHDPHLQWTINGHITEEHLLWSEQHRQWLQGPVIFRVMKSIFMSMAGFVAGMLEASVRIAEGIAYAFWHPIKTLQGISYAFWNINKVGKHLWTEITTAYIEMVLYGNDFSAGKFYGEMTVEVLASVFTIAKAKQVAGVGHASKLLPSTVLGGKVAQGSGLLSLGSLTGFIGNISSRAKKFFNQLREGLKKHGDEVAGGSSKLIDPNLVEELAQSGQKFTRENLVGITKTPVGKIVWLEKGNASAGLEHIMQRHAKEFASTGLNSSDEIAEFIIKTVKLSDGIKDGGATIFDVVMGGKQRQLKVVIGDNGFIVTAYPFSK